MSLDSTDPRAIKEAVRRIQEKQRITTGAGFTRPKSDILALKKPINPKPAWNKKIHPPIGEIRDDLIKNTTGEKCGACKRKEAVGEVGCWRKGDDYIRYVYCSVDACHTTAIHSIEYQRDHLPVKKVPLPAKAEKPANQSPQSPGWRHHHVLPD